MKQLEKLAEKVYSENDFGRSIATSLSGIIGLAVYLISKDWVIAIFSLIITFPIIRLISSNLNEKFKKSKHNKIKKANAQKKLNSLSLEEMSVVSVFVKHGSSVLTWDQANREESISGSAIESLIQRELICTSMTADGMRETFALDTEFFEIAVAHNKL